MLSFPNQSRFYDAARRVVRFWGHVSAMEASFFVNERIQSDMRLDEAGLLSVLRFNANGIRGLLGRPYDGSSLKQTYEHLNALVQEHLKSNARR
jgi:hypothetical protein